MAEGLLQLGDYDITAYWQVEGHGFGGENLTFSTFHSGLEEYDVDVVEGMTEMSYTLSPVRPTTWANIQTNYRSLVGEIRKQTNILQLRAPNTDEIFTYDTFRSPVPSMFGHEGPAVSVTHNVMIELTIRRRPYPRTDTLLASVNKLSNSWPLKEGATAGRPLNWEWDDDTGVSAETIDTDGYHFTRATIAEAQFHNAFGLPNTGADPGDVWTMSVDITALGGVAKAAARIEFLDSDTNVQATHTGTLTLIDGTERLSVTSDAAPANTVEAMGSVFFDHDVATAVAITLNKLQLEEASTASEYRMGVETLSNDPAGFCVLPVWNPGDADARSDTVLGNTNADQILVGLYQGPNLADYMNHGLSIPSNDADNGLRIFVDLVGETVRTTGLGASYSGGDALVTSNFGAGAVLQDRAGWFSLSTYAAGTTERKQFDSLRGHSYLVVGRYLATASATFLLRIQHGFAVGPSLRHSGDTLTWAPSLLGTPFDIPLGTITISDQDERFELYFQAGRSSGTGNLHLDLAWLVPLDALLLIDVPSTGGFVGFDAHAERSVTMRADTPTSKAIATAPSQGSVPVIPQGLSGLVVMRWQSLSQEELMLKPKRLNLTDTAQCYTDITPQRYQ